jgi:hypothetical protein
LRAIIGAYVDLRAAKVRCFHSIRDTL